MMKKHEVKLPRNIVYREPASLSLGAESPMGKRLFHPVEQEQLEGFAGIDHTYRSDAHHDSIIKIVVPFGWLAAPITGPGGFCGSN